MNPKGIIALIARIRDRANRVIVQELEENKIKGLAPSHGNILVKLFINKSVTMKELAESIDKDKSTITSLVDKLVRFGYVEKVKDLEDTRVTHVKLTKKGAMLEPVFWEISIKIISKVYNGIFEKDQKTLMSLLNKIYQNLE